MPEHDQPETPAAPSQPPPSPDDPQAQGDQPGDDAGRQETVEETAKRKLQAHQADLDRLNEEHGNT